MPPPVRKTFFLGFHKKPNPAADVYREDVVVGGKGAIKVGATVDIRKGRARTDTAVVVLAIGFQTHLKKLQVDKDGTVFSGNEPEPDNMVGTPHEEKLKAKAKSMEVLRERHLQDVANGLAIEGDFSCVPPKKVCRQPHRLNADEMIVLDNKLKNLPCLKKKSGDVALVNGCTTFANGAALNYLQADCEDKPITLFRKILVLLLGKQLLADPGLCATEAGAQHRGKVAVPKEIVADAYGFCTLKCPGTCQFEPSYILRTYLNKCQNKKKNQDGPQAALQPAAEQQVEQSLNFQDVDQTLQVENLPLTVESADHGSEDLRSFVDNQLEVDGLGDHGSGMIVTSDAGSTYVNLR